MHGPPPSAVPLLASLLACSPGDGDGRPADVLVDVLADGVWSARVTPDGGVLAVDPDGGLTYADPHTDAVADLGEAERVLGAGALPDGTLILAATSGLWAWSDSAASPSDLAAATPGTLEAVTPHGATVWMRTTAGLYRWADDQLASVTVDGAPATGPFAPGGVVDQRPVVWVSGRFGAAALALDDTPDVLAQRPGPVHDVAVDARGQAWVVFGDGVWTWGDRGWARVDVPATALAAGPSAEGAWATGPGGVWVLDADGATSVDTAPPQDLHATPLGAAGVVDGQLVHLAREQAAAAVLPADGAVLDAATPVVGWATDAAGATLELVADGEPVRMTPLTVLPGWRAVLEPAALPAGDVALGVTATWDGQTVDAGAATVQIALTGPITWDEHIGPLYGDRCAHCHDSGTETVLTGADTWQARLDDILVEVSLGRMPVGGPALTDGEIAMIEAWADGGFP